MKTINKSYKLRIYPNEKQKILLSKHFGCNRFVFNYYLEKQKESYELAAGYFRHGVTVARNCEKPILVFIGDESPYPNLLASQLERFGISTENQSVEQLFKELCEIYEVFLIHKPYSSHGVTELVREDWKKILPEEHILPLSEPERVVDVLFGILAGVTAKVDYFHDELVSRQTPEQVSTVMCSLKPFFDKLKGTVSSEGKSTFHKLPTGTKSKPLL